MLSRVADSLYWMSRYLERAEHTTRLLDVNLNLMLDESSSGADHRWQRMVAALGIAVARSYLRYGKSHLSTLLHHRGTGECTPCPRADLHRDVAPA